MNLPPLAAVGDIVSGTTGSNRHWLMAEQEARVIMSPGRPAKKQLLKRKCLYHDTLVIYAQVYILSMIDLAYD